MSSDQQRLHTFPRWGVAGSNPVVRFRTSPVDLPETGEDTALVVQPAADEHVARRRTAIRSVRSEARCC
jgi:hypothetical protein